MKKLLPVSLLLAALVGWGISLNFLAHADEDDWRELHDDVRAGRLVSLPRILDWLEAHYLGVILEIELERDGEQPRYEVEMLGPQGQLVEFEFDATNGKLVETEGINIEDMERP
ncbi:PepSY domain-containing protein [Halomonas sp. WWR20]